MCSPASNLYTVFIYTYFYWNSQIESPFSQDADCTLKIYITKAVYRMCIEPKGFEAINGSAVRTQQRNIVILRSRDIFHISPTWWRNCNSVLGRQRARLIAAVNQYMITNLMLLLDYKSGILNYEPRAMGTGPPSGAFCPQMSCRWQGWLFLQC